MRRTRRRVLLGLAATAAVLAGTAVPAQSALAGATLTGTRQLGPGVALSTFSVPGGTGTVTGELIAADLTNRHVSVDLLHPPAVGEDEQVTQMAADAGAVAGVNADFFDISESQHPGVAATGSSDGPEVTGSTPLKAAVPDAQRFGPAMAPGTSTRDVIGVGADGRARLGSLTLTGTVTAGSHRYALGGYNQYALPEDSIGAYTPAWGAVSRERAVCGSDTNRGDPCTGDAEEVTVSHGKVVSVSDTVGSGEIAAGSTVLVGREAGADELRGLAIGDRVSVHYGLASDGVPFRFAVGGAPILRGGATLSGVDAVTAATRTGAGISADGRHLYLVTLDGSTESGAGLTLAQLADLLASFGASDGINLDGGGSTTCAARIDNTVTMCNTLAAGTTERAVANGIGIFTR
jgi:phosphodiester glycosidase